MKHIVIPMAGEGQRFKNEGYQVSKPSLPIPNVFRNGQETSMVIGAIDSLTSIYDHAEIHLVHRDFHIKEGVVEKLKQDIPHIKTYELKKLTEGQAISCATATQELAFEDEVLVGACDSGFLADKQAFDELRAVADAIVFVFKDNPIVEGNPQAYGWVDVDPRGHVVNISVKKPLSENPVKDYAICGTFWFKKVGIYNQYLKQMIQLNLKVNNEFYIDELINIYLKNQMKVCVLPVDILFCWGTPQDYENYKLTYNYWNEFLLDEGLRHL